MATTQPLKHPAVAVKPVWKISENPVPYPAAIAEMEAHVAAMQQGAAQEKIWLLEHPSLYTAGTSAKPQDLIHSRFPVFKTGRGGQYTYHGPGQKIAYVMLDLNRRGRDIRQFIFNLEEWIILTLACFDIRGERREGKVGIWVDMGPYGYPPGTEAKIAAIGVRVRKWITYHGISINIDPNLDHYNGIIPCGISDQGVTSLANLGKNITHQDINENLKNCFKMVF